MPYDNVKELMEAVDRDIELDKMTEFGDYLKELRRAKKLTLRKFCAKVGVDPGNQSKIERGLQNPPMGDKLMFYARALDLKEGTEEWGRFRDLAYLCAKKIPPDMRECVTELLSAINEIRIEKIEERKESK